VTPASQSTVFGGLGGPGLVFDARGSIRPPRPVVPYGTPEYDGPRDPGGPSATAKRAVRIAVL
jgi:hypothetical protein